MQNKYRSYPPAVPLKMNKLLEYQYFFQIYKKYDCNFFRQILPYFSEIIKTDKLETLKFIYVPIQNPYRVKKIQIGIPFQPQIQNKNPSLCQLTKEVIFIKITYQTHIIFQYLMNLNLLNVAIQKLKFQDKFWLFSEGILRSYRFNSLAYKNQGQLSRQNSPGIYFILEGQFKCFDTHKKNFKTIGKGYIIDLNGKLKKSKFQENFQQIVISKEIPNKMIKKEKQCKQQKLVQQQYEEQLHELWSNTNNSKILFLDWNTVKKYAAECDQNIQNHQHIGHNKIIPIKIQQPSTMLQQNTLMKCRRLKTQKQESKVRKTYNNESQTLMKKFNLISCRGPTNFINKIQLNPIEEISNNQILKSYIKDNELYQKIKKQKIENKHKRFFSNNQRQKQNDLFQNQNKLLSFFKKELVEESQKVSLKRRKTKQLYPYHKKSSESKQNFFQKTSKNIENVQNNLNSKQQSSVDNKKSIKRLSKTELSAFQLLKRNLFNKEYHRADFVPILQ